MSKSTVERQLAGAALLFAALGDPTRLTLLDRLSTGGPASISALAEQFSISRQGVTKHLEVLEAAGVIEGARQGRERVWRLNPARLADGQRCLELIARGWEDALGRLKAHVEQSGQDGQSGQSGQSGRSGELGGVGGWEAE